MSGQRTRAVAREITITASVEAVWEALTDAEELTRWFPPVARVEPGAGGRLWRAWPSGEEIEERIERWVPCAHLRTVGVRGSWSGIVTDYHLTSRGGETMLRVVSSGFGDGDTWDMLADAFGGGWDFELRGLKHYLEHHRGRARVVALARVSHSTSASECWERIVGVGGWLGLGRTAPRYEAVLATGQRLSGTIRLWQPPRQLAATVDELNNAYLRVDTRCLGETGAPWVWLSTYGLQPDTVREIERDWQASLDAAFSKHPA